MRRRTGARLRAQQIMTSPVVSVTGATSVKEAVRLMLAHRISGLPVVDERGQPIGVITLRDVARYAEWHMEAEDAAEDRWSAAGRDREGEEEAGGGMHIDRLARATVSQLMTPGVVGVCWDAGLEEIIGMLLRYRVHRVFVHDTKGCLVGVVSTLDILRALYPRLEDFARVRRQLRAALRKAGG